MKKLLIILTIFLLPSLASANFSVKFENTFNKKVFYMLYWIDHPYDWPKPANIAGGELDSLKNRELSSQYRHGKYYVIWWDNDDWKHEMLMEIKAGVTQITIRPENWISGKRGI